MTDDIWFDPEQYKSGELVECPKCGEEFRDVGLATHMRSCDATG